MPDKCYWLLQRLNFSALTELLPISPIGATWLSFASYGNFADCEVENKQKVRRLWYDRMCWKSALTLVSTALCLPWVSLHLSFIVRSGLLARLCVAPHTTTAAIVTEQKWSAELVRMVEAHRRRSLRIPHRSHWCKLQEGSQTWPTPRSAALYGPGPVIELVLAHMGATVCIDQVSSYHYCLSKPKPMPFIYFTTSSQCLTFNC